MAHGLQVYDGAGDLILDVSDRIGRYVSTVTCTIPAVNATIFVSIPGYSMDGTWFLFGYVPDWVLVNDGSGGLSVTNKGSNLVGQTFKFLVFRG